VLGPEHALIVFLSHREIAASQARIESLPNLLNAQRSVVAEEVTKRPSRNPVDDLVIGEGDLLEISLHGVPDFNHHVRVDTSGEFPCG
jgi:hypothetical protein